MSKDNVALGREAGDYTHTGVTPAFAGWVLLTHLVLFSTIDTLLKLEIIVRLIWESSDSDRDDIVVI